MSTFATAQLGLDKARHFSKPSGSKPLTKQATDHLRVERGRFDRASATMQGLGVDTTALAAPLVANPSANRRSAAFAGEVRVTHQ